MRALRRLLLLCVPLCYAPLRVAELAQLKAFYNATNGAAWKVNTNWDMDATSQCATPLDNGVGQGWPYVAPETEQPTGLACHHKEPCSWDTKWHGVGCVDPCYAPTDGDNCVFGRVTYLNLKENSLEGTIPDAFFDELINITLVDLSFNYLSGTIPTEV